MKRLGFETAWLWLLLSCTSQHTPARVVRDGPTPPPQRRPQVEQAAPSVEQATKRALNDQGLRWVIARALRRRELPGCVVAIGTSQGLRYLEAFGERTAGEPMTVDTRFDLASLTKPLATTLALMRLHDLGRLDLNAPVARYVPAFDRPDKRDIRVAQLLLHTSGLPKVSRLSHMEQGRERALDHIASLPLRTKPGARFEYSDLGFIVLGELVSRLTGQPLDAWVRAELYAPLGLHDTGFVPGGDAPERYAPTEKRDDASIRGVVDDPRAYRLGGVAGHAGLFSTAREVAELARLMLRRGELHGRRLFSSETADTFLTPRSVPLGTRALGWDADSAYAHGRGLNMSERAFGHGGYTGTSLWVDPAQDLFVVFLSNRVHMEPRGRIHPLASAVGDMAARMLKEAEGPPRAGVGIDVLSDEAFARLRGRSVVLLTHQAARGSAGESTFERVRTAPQVELTAVLSPEHGFFADAEGHVKSTRLKGLPVHSLFGKKRRPEPHMLRGADTLVIDLVDVGTRFYTYMKTVLEATLAAHAQGLEVMLLDRPNPLDGTHVEGPLSQVEYASFVNYHPLPVRHGMTAGELLRFLLAARKLDAQLHVVPVRGWSRGRWIGATPFAWHAPSPNLGTASQAMLYPAVGLVEGTNLSVGRGTGRAFHVVGAPFVDGPALRDALAAYPLLGVTVQATRFRPTVGPYAGEHLSGIELQLSDASAFSSAATGLALIRALTSLYPAEWKRERLERLVANRGVLDLLAQKAPLERLVDAASGADLSAFRAARRDALLYP